LLPLLDIILPIDKINPDDDDHKKLVNEMRFVIPVYLSVIMDWVGYLWGINYIMKNNLGLLFNFGTIFGIITMEATNFNMAHELFHKKSFISKFVGTSSLLKSLNTHFIIEHNYHHHKWVSTPVDTATSKYNEPSYIFVYKYMFFSYIHGWQCENDRCNQSYGTFLTYKNYMIWSTLSCILFPFYGYYFYGYNGLLLQLVIALGASSFLELINYIEHYGLRRKFISPTGKYESTNINHSWNAPYRISNYFLFKLQRHSDHHENALKPYQVLATYDQSPQLPQGYSVCVIVAVLPSLWFSVMNPILEAYQKGTTPSKEVLSKSNFLIYMFLTFVNVSLLGLVVINEIYK
jgi:alkane 1-monooxygenase